MRIPILNSTLILLIMVHFHLFGQVEVPSIAGSKPPTSNELMLKRITVIDSLFEDGSRVKKFTKTKQGVIEVRNGEWPDEIKTTYNVLNDAGGMVIAVQESPFSESGDWGATMTHYFDEDGKTFAVTKWSSSFENCPTEVHQVFVTIISLYDKSFKPISKSYEMKDENGRDFKCGRLDMMSDAKQVSNVKLYSVIRSLSKVYEIHGESLRLKQDDEGFSGIGLDMRNRRFTYLKLPPKYNNKPGRVAVSITVNRSGAVISAVPGVKGTTLTDKDVWELFRRAVMASRLNPLDTAPEIQTGVVIFNFKAD